MNNLRGFQAINLFTCNALASRRYHPSPGRFVIEGTAVEEEESADVTVVSIPLGIDASPVVAIAARKGKNGVNQGSDVVGPSVFKQPRDHGDDDEMYSFFPLLFSLYCACRYDQSKMT